MSEQEGNGLSLEGLAHRLEMLERENTELRSKVATLGSSGTRRDELAVNRGSDTPRSKEATSAFAGQVSRRSVLSKAGAAAVAAVAAGTLFNQRQAKATHYPQVLLEADQVHTHVVVADTVAARNTGTTGGALLGEAAAANEAGVYGAHTVGGHGVWGEGVGANYAGVFGRNSNGYGGQFEGGRAQLRLHPTSTTGKPTSGAHQKGELYMDSAARLFICTKGGTPGTWRRVNTTSV